MTKMTPNSAPTDFANFGRRYFHFQLAPSNKLGCYGLGMTSATIGDIRVRQLFVSPKNWVSKSSTMSFFHYERLIVDLLMRKLR